MTKTLLQITRNEISERMMLENASFYDPIILRAIDKYLLKSNIHQQAINFIQELQPIFLAHEKENYIKVFIDYIEIESGIESYTNKYTTHIDHVIQEFLLGYNILHSSKAILNDFKYSEGKDIISSEFNNMLFAWMVAALFHDTGYDIEKFNEEELFREKKNNYWSFLTKRQATTGIQINNNHEIVKAVEEILLPKFNKLFETKYNYNQFISLFTHNGSYDHALISTLKYLEQLIKLDKGTGDYLNWEPNYDAMFGMLLHNLKHKETDIMLSFDNKNHMIPYLILISDEIEYWERKKVIQLDSPKYVSSIELDNISFKSEYAYLIINHIVETDKIKEYKDDFIKRIINDTLKFPVRILSTDIFNEINREFKEIQKKIIQRETILYLFDAGNRNFSESHIDQVFETYKLNIEKTEKEELLAKIISNNKILVPSDQYKIIVEHCINRKNTLTMEFML